MISVYLQLAPSIALFTEDNNVSMYSQEYLGLQLCAFALFALPLTFIYLFRQPKGTFIVKYCTPIPWRTNTVSALGLLLGGLFQIVVLKENLQFMRLGDGLAQTLVSLPAWEFCVLRLYVETAFFLIGIALHSYWYASSLSVKGCALFSVVCNLAIFGLLALLNSRFFIIMLSIFGFGWWLSIDPDRLRRKHVIYIAALTALSYCAICVCVNVRSAGGIDGGLTLSHLNPDITANNDETVAMRLDGIDLMARLSPAISKEGPAWGSAWQSSLWLVWRFVDPDGFNEHRLSLQTTSKSYLMAHYLNWIQSDYYACTLTDMYGNFGLLGFPMAAVIIASLFRLHYRASHTPCGRMLILSLFLITHILNCDQEASNLLFGWIRKVPVLVAVLFLNPLSISSESDQVSEPREATGEGEREARVSPISI